MSSDDSFSIITRLFHSSNSRRGMAIHQAIVGIVLLILHSAKIASNDTTVDSGLNSLVNWFTYYAVFSLLATAYIIVTRPFITPEVKSPKCNFCGAPMKTAKLVCDNCESDSNKGKI